MSMGSKLFSSTLIGGMCPNLSARIKTYSCTCRCWELLFHIVGTGPHCRAVHLFFFFYYKPMFSQVFIYLCEEVSHTCNLRFSMLIGRGALAAYKQVLVCVRCKNMTIEIFLYYLRRLFANIAIIHAE